MTTRMKESRVATTAVNQHWQTPPHVLARIREWQPIVLDPCANVNSRCGEVNFLGPGHVDGLKTPWSHVDGLTRHGVAFVNPPFEDAGAWMGKCGYEATEGVRSIMLLPHRSDTRMWQTHVRLSVTHVVNLAGRLRYGGLSRSQLQAVGALQAHFWATHPSPHGMPASQAKKLVKQLEAREKSLVDRLMREGPPPEQNEDLFQMGTSQFPSVLLHFSPGRGDDGFEQHFGSDPDFGFVVRVC